MCLPLCEPSAYPFDVSHAKLVGMEFLLIEVVHLSTYIKLCTKCTKQMESGIPCYVRIKCNKNSEQIGKNIFIKIKALKFILATLK
jgi:hypothetical protein